MSTWLCPACMTLTGPTNAPCPKCGSSVERAIIATGPPRREDAAGERLDRLADLKWDWDSYGSPPIGKRAIDCARRLMVVLSHPPQVVPTSQGGVQLEWHRDGLDLDLTIPPEGAAEFFASPPDDDGALQQENARLRAALSTAERERGDITLSADDVEALRFCVTTADRFAREHATSAVIGKLARAYDVLARVPSGGEPRARTPESHE